MSIENKIMKDLINKIADDLLPKINLIDKSEKLDELRNNIELLKAVFETQINNYDTSGINLAKISTEITEVNQNLNTQKTCLKWVGEI